MSHIVETNYRQPSLSSEFLEFDQKIISAKRGSTNRWKDLIIFRPRVAVKVSQVVHPILLLTKTVNCV
jgi:hypothetical protein